MEEAPEDTNDVDAEKKSDDADDLAAEKKQKKKKKRNPQLVVGGFGSLHTLSLIHISEPTRPY